MSTYTLYNISKGREGDIDRCKLSEMTLQKACPIILLTSIPLEHGSMWGSRSTLDWSTDKLAPSPVSALAICP